MAIVAIVGRPNVGKSTLFNRLTESRAAIVQETSGVTRDRHYGKAEWNGIEFSLIDTGGYVKGSDDIFEGEIRKQVVIALEEANAVVFVVDVETGITDLDESVAKLLRKTKKPTFVVVNKVDNSERINDTYEFYNFGLENVVNISAINGSGTGELLDGLTDALKELDKPLEIDADLPRIAIVGKPNVGKSTLINGLLGEDRFIAFDQPGTTRDAISTEFNWGKDTYILTDTAGIRKKGKVFETIEKFSIIKTLNALEESNIVILLIDGKEGLTAQDLHILAFILETGRSLVVAVNKWDSLDIYEKDKIKNQIDRKLSFVNFAEVVFISALNKTGFSEMMKATKKAYLSSQKKLTTPQINSVLENALITHPPKIIKGIRPKLKYAHQGGLNPPQIIIHGNHLNEIKKDYLVFLESFFRKSFHLVGTPIKVLLKNSDNPFDKKDSKPKKTGLVTRRKIKNEFREKLNKKNISNQS